jgi:N-acetylglucosaminyl-diphospho-decaprenol L-rhamnosyltransferase
MAPSVAVVIVCYDNAEQVPATLRALRPQLERGDQVIVVDNDSADGTPTVVEQVDADATVIKTGRNLGFAGGCQVGARASKAPLLLFLNPDAIPAPGCLAALRAVAEDFPSWGAWQALVTLADGAHVNTAGNFVHWLGFGWAGGLGLRVDDINRSPHEVGFASGAALLVRRDAWDATGGFDQRYFMYGEDLDLALRLRLAGWGIGVTPAARVAHDYSFVKGDYKWFYLERNRWWTLLSAYPGRLLVLVAPALVAFELVLLVAAWRGRWLRAKLRSQVAVLRSLPATLARRRAVQETRTISERAFAEHLTASLDSPYLRDAERVPGLRATQAALWRAILALLR